MTKLGLFLILLVSFTVAGCGNNEQSASGTTPPASSKIADPSGDEKAALIEMYRQAEAAYRQAFQVDTPDSFIRAIRNGPDVLDASKALREAQNARKATWLGLPKKRLSAVSSAAQAARNVAAEKIQKEVGELAIGASPDKIADMALRMEEKFQKAIAP